MYSTSLRASKGFPMATSCPSPEGEPQRRGESADSLLFSPHQTSTQETLPIAGFFRTQTRDCMSCSGRGITAQSPLGRAHDMCSEVGGNVRVVYFAKVVPVYSIPKAV